MTDLETLKDLLSLASDPKRDEILEHLALSMTCKEEKKSHVRVYVTYGAFALVAIIGLWGLMWMADRTLATAVLTPAIGWIGYWFGQRNKDK